MRTPGPPEAKIAALQREISFIDAKIDALRLRRQDAFDKIRRLRFEGALAPAAQIAPAMSCS